MSKFEIILESEDGLRYKIEDILSIGGSNCHSINRIYSKVDENNVVIKKYALNSAIYLPKEQGVVFHEGVFKRNPDSKLGDIMYWGSNIYPFTSNTICKESFSEGYLFNSEGRIFFLRDIENKVGKVYATGRIINIEIPHEYEGIWERATGKTKKNQSTTRKIPKAIVNNIEEAVGRSMASGTVGSSDPQSPLFLRKKKR